MTFAAVLERREVVKMYRKRLVVGGEIRSGSKGDSPPVRDGQPFAQALLPSSLDNGPQDRSRYELRIGIRQALCLAGCVAGTPIDRVSDDFLSSK